MTMPGNQGNVIGVMKMGNILPIVGTESTSLAFWANVLPLHHVGFLMSPRYPRLTVYCSSLPQRSVQTTTVIILGPVLIHDNMHSWRRFYSDATL